MIEIETLLLIIKLLFAGLVSVTIITFTLIIAIVVIMSKQKKKKKNTHLYCRKKMCVFNT